MTNETMRAHTDALNRHAAALEYTNQHGPAWDLAQADAATRAVTHMCNLERIAEHNETFTTV